MKAHRLPGAAGPCRANGRAGSCAVIEPLSAPVAAPVRPPGDLYERLRACFPGVEEDRGEVWTPCPWCGKGGRHFSFSRLGCHCFVCGRGGSLRALADRLGVDPGGEALQGDWPAPAPVRVAAPWQARAIEIVFHAMRHPGRLAAWAAYKPLRPETLNRHCFGLGRLPFRGPNGEWRWSKAWWLIVPLFGDDAGGRGAVVGLRGRNTGCAAPKWISASGSTSVLWNAAGVRGGCVTWIVENYVDAAWMMERHPEVDAVALGGVHWRPEWAVQLAARRPQQVIVALDNDLAGQAGGATLRRLRSEWRAAHPGLQPPEPNGPRIVRSLRAAGIDDVLLFPWTEDAPDHADVGWLLAQKENA